MKKLSVLFCLMLSMGLLFAQQETIKFVGHNLNDNKYIQLSKIEVTNLTQNWTETLFYPDTTLTLKVSVGIDDQAEYALGLKQNNPNPFVGTTDVNLEVAKAGKVTMELTDILGRKVKTFSTTIANPGNHAFRVHVASTGTYVLTARQNGKVSSIKMINHGVGNSDNIAYVGAAATLSYTCKNGSKGSIDKPFFYGDKLEFKGYAEVQAGEVEGIAVWREEINSETIKLPINLNSENFVCGVSSVTDIDGNIYNTVLLDRQCWMKENMRVSRFPSGQIIALSNEQSEITPCRFLAGDDEEKVEELGYLYNWFAVMNQRKASDLVPSGVQGLCPAGWHVPSAQEYLDLYDYVASVADYVCDESDTAHATISKALCSKEGWRQGSFSPCSAGKNSENNNATGFSIVPAGYFGAEGAKNVGISSYLWTTSENPDTWQDDAHNQYIDFGLTFMQNTSAWKKAGYSVRCLRDY